MEGSWRVCNGFDEFMQLANFRGIWCKNALGNLLY